MKREWQYTPENSMAAGILIKDYALWALVERLGALVSIMDELEQVGDVIANHLSFGGQPVGEGTHPANWQCQKTESCSLFNGHQGACIRPHDHVVGTELCPCVHPATSAVCQLLAGHDGIHAFPEPGESDMEPREVKIKPVDGLLEKLTGTSVITPSRTCQCVTPQFDASNVCGKCGFPMLEVI